MESSRRTQSLFCAKIDRFRRKRLTESDKMFLKDVQLVFNLQIGRRPAEPAGAPLCTASVGGRSHVEVITLGGATARRLG